MNMYSRHKYELCEIYFNKLINALKDYNYDSVPSINSDCSEYLIPNGTINELTYKSKPAFSFRYSDHWNWFANIKKCENEKYVQCFSTDLPYTKLRRGPGLPSKPIFAISVMITDATGRYHCIYGETYDRKKREWGWKETPIEDVVRMVEERKVW